MIVFLRGLDLTQWVLKQQIKIVAFELLPKEGWLIRLLNRGVYWIALVELVIESLRRCRHIVDGRDVDVIVDWPLLGMVHWLSYAGLTHFLLEWTTLLSPYSIALEIYLSHSLSWQYFMNWWSLSPQVLIVWRQCVITHHSMPLDSLSLSGSGGWVIPSLEVAVLLFGQVLVLHSVSWSKANRRGKLRILVPLGFLGDSLFERKGLVNIFSEVGYLWFKVAVIGCFLWTQIQPHKLPSLLSHRTFLHCALKLSGSAEGGFHFLNLRASIVQVIIENCVLGTDFEFVSCMRQVLKQCSLTYIILMRHMLTVPFLLAKQPGCLVAHCILVWII